MWEGGGGRAGPARPAGTAPPPALVSKHMLTRMPSGYARFDALYMRARLGTSARASSGACWRRPPWHFANVTRERLAGISDGIDDCMLARMVDNGTRRAGHVRDREWGREGAGF